MFDRDGNQTPLGKASLAALDSLTGVRYKRGRLGLWVGVEGMIYEEWNRDIHLIDRFDIPTSWRRIRTVDFGFTNPFICQWWALDEDDRLYLYREIYMSKRTVRSHAERINVLSEGETYIATIADHDAEDRATLHENGIYTVPADKRVNVGIEKVQERLKVQGDNRARLFIMRDSLVEKDTTLETVFKPTCTAEEFPAYVWEPAAQNSTVKRSAKEAPLKVDDHGMDATRYGVMYFDSGRPQADANPFY